MQMQMTGNGFLFCFFSVFLSQVIFFFKRLILQKYCSPCSIYWISWQILVNFISQQKYWHGNTSLHWHSFLKSTCTCSHHFVCMKIFRKWRCWIGLKWNDDIQDKENEMQRLFREGKDFLCNTIQHLLVSSNIANEWLLFIPLISYWAICCWKAISIKISSVYMSCKGKFYVEIQWNSVRKSFGGRAFEDALGLSSFYIFFDNSLESGCR